MKKKKIITISLIVLAIVLILSALFNSTYALFSKTDYGANPNVYSTGTLSIESKSKSSNISLTNALPISDEDGKESTPYVFTITNTGNLDYKFNVKLLSTSTNTFSPQYIKLQIDDSKVTTLSSLSGSVIKSDITLKAGKSIDISIRAWLSIDTPNTQLGKSFNSKIVIDGQAIYTQTSGAEYITNLYTNAPKEAVINNNITYNYATSVSMMNDRLGGTTTSLDGGNIRYYGSDPNNYIYFNCNDYNNQSSSTCELWRIIGVFDDKIKIINSPKIDSYPWANTNINDWTEASLMKLLNPGYENIGIGGSLYYYGESGTCYSGSSSTKTCNFTSSGTTPGLKNDETRNKIAEVTWNIGGYNSSAVYSDQIYVDERGETTYQNSRPTTWTGKVALMYPSDYGYATDFNKCSQTLFNYNSNIDNYACRGNDWIFKGNTNENTWLLTSSSSNSSNAWNINLSGYVSYLSTNYSYVVRPVLYLNADEVIASGTTGSSTNPYRLLP